MSSGSGIPDPQDRLQQPRTRRRETAPFHRAPADNGVDFSQVAHLFKALRHLQANDAREFEQVMNDAAAQLRTAAAGSAEFAQAEILNRFAERFRMAAQTRDVSPLQANFSFDRLTSPLPSLPGPEHHSRGGGRTWDFLTASDNVG